MLGRVCPAPPSFPSSNGGVRCALASSNPLDTFYPATVRNQLHRIASWTVASQFKGARRSLDPPPWPPSPSKMKAATLAGSTARSPWWSAQGAGTATADRQKEQGVPLLPTEGAGTATADQREEQELLLLPAEEAGTAVEEGTTTAAGGGNERIGGRSNATTENVAWNTDGDLGWVQEEIAKLQKLRLEIEKTTRQNRFHNRFIIGSVFAGLGLGGLACAWYTRSYRKALKEHLDNPIV
uniref:Transmembrane protein n=1 Tax=Oryza punctata TaxID=4537 RepID=A0A0E0LH81_ORYPU